MNIYDFDRVENIVGKRENAGYQHFLLFPQCFQKLFFPRVFKSRNDKRSMPNHAVPISKDPRKHAF